MAGRRFEVADVAAVLQHWQAGRSRRQLARSFGMEGNRIDRIVGVAEAAGLPQVGRRSAGPEWERRVPELFADRVAPAAAPPTQELVRFHAAIVEGLAASTVTTVWAAVVRRAGADRERVDLPPLRAPAHSGMSPEDVTVPRR